jgi:hypothetical protein
VEAPGGQFLVAKFNIAGSDNSQAAVNVSMSAGDGGGLVSNVNRWRRQLGLPELPDAEVQNSRLVEVEAGKGRSSIWLARIPGPIKRLACWGVMVPAEGQTWYYKLMGPEQLVGSREEQASLTSSRLPNTRMLDCLINLLYLASLNCRLPGFRNAVGVRRNDGSGRYGLVQSSNTSSSAPTFVLWKLPGLPLTLPLPGGYLVGGVLLINLVASHFQTF